MGNKGPWRPASSALEASKTLLMDLPRCVSRPDDELQRFRSCLRVMCMDQTTTLHTVLSWTLFFILAVAIPAVSHLVLTFRPQRRPYDAAVQVSLSAASTASFLCLSSLIRRYGLRRFLFLNRRHLPRHSWRVVSGYSAELSRSFHITALFVFPCFAAEIAYKSWWYLAGVGQIPLVGNQVIGEAIAATLELISWLYRTAVFFLACILFRLTCHLQLLRLQDFAAVFEQQSDVKSILKEHLDIRRQLKVLSHRFRLFIVTCMLIVTASQFVTVLLTTRRDSDDDLFNTGELALSSVVLVAGLLIILRSATKITHQAQALTGHAAKWHACSTIENVEEPSETAGVLPDQANESHSDSSDYETGDDDSVSSTRILLPTASTISFQKRQALVAYLENNRTGITVYGFMLDRSWLHTIFALQWTLFLWLLGKTVGFS